MEAILWISCAILTLSAFMVIWGLARILHHLYLED